MYKSILKTSDIYSVKLVYNNLINTIYSKKFTKMNLYWDYNTIHIKEGDE